jgi:hypothetical protein
LVVNQGPEDNWPRKKIRYQKSHDRVSLISTGTGTGTGNRLSTCDYLYDAGNGTDTNNNNIIEIGFENKRILCIKAKYANYGTNTVTIVPSSALVSCRGHLEIILYFVALHQYFASKYPRYCQGTGYSA